MYRLTTISPLASLLKARPAILINSRQICLTTNLNKDFRHSEDLAKERYDTRANEDIDRKRARLLYQSRKRGMLENGVILASFADRYLDKLDPQQLDQYDRLINLPTNDWDIFHWATRTKPTPEEYETPVMQMLRDHLKSKVSKHTEQASGEVEPWKDKKKSQSFLDGMHPDDIAMPAAIPRFKTLKDVNIKQINLTDVEGDLFDMRKRKLNKTSYVNEMTEWRRKYFLKKIKRTLPAPILAKQLDESKPVEVFTQKASTNDVAVNNLPVNDLIDSTYERNMKQHDILQRLMGSKFTDNVIEYDAEAEAWASMIWLREYGKFDYSIALTTMKCNSCKARLQCCDTGLNGYVPKELLAKLMNSTNPQVEQKCQRCKFKQTYGVSMNADVRNTEFIGMMRHLVTLPASIVIYLVDLTDFPAGIWPGIGSMIGLKHRLIVVGNKLDLLPYDGIGMIDRVTESVRGNLTRLRPGESHLNLTDVMVMSARTGFGLEGLVSRIHSLTPTPRDVYLIGCSNSGKSTLFNAMLQSDLCQVRNFDLLSRVSKYTYPNTELSLLRFPLRLPEGWEIEMSKRQQIRRERNFVRQELKLGSSTARRQASMPHMSMLINRLDYPAINALDTVDGHCNQQVEPNSVKPRFTEDHPLANIDQPPPLSADETRNENNSFCYYTPSTVNRDQLHNIFTVEERLWIYPQETLIPRKYSLRPLETIFIAGVARLDLLTSTSNVIITIFASKLLPIHVIATRKADSFYHSFLGTPYLGVPFGDQKRFARWPKLEHRGEQSDILIEGTHHTRGEIDVVFGSIGWALVNVAEDQECIIRPYTPGARGIFKRDPPLLAYGRKLSGKKIRNTPLFEHEVYTHERVKVS